MLNKTPFLVLSADLLLEQFHRSREHSTDLILNLSTEEFQAQSMDDVSPA